MHNLLVFVTLCALFVCIAGSKNPVDAINKWDADDVKQFFESASGNKIDEAVMKSLGLVDGNTFITIMRSEEADETIASIITSGSFFDSKEKKIARVKAAVHDYTKDDAELTDFYEWRWLNRKLCDFWIVPMFASPRMLLLWARFYDQNHSIEKINDEIDEISIPTFWTYWCISPSALLLQVTTKFNCNSFLDEVIDSALAICAVEEVLIAITVISCFLFVQLSNGAATPVQKLYALLARYVQLDMIVLVVSWISYYIIAPILYKRFFVVCDVLFYTALYLIIPALTLYKLNHISEKFRESGLI